MFYASKLSQEHVSVASWEALGKGQEAGMSTGRPSFYFMDVGSEV